MLPAPASVNVTRARVDVRVASTCVNELPPFVEYSAMPFSPLSSVPLVTRSNASVTVLQPVVLMLPLRIDPSVPPKVPPMTAPLLETLTGPADVNGARPPSNVWFSSVPAQLPGGGGGGG